MTCELKSTDLQNVLAVIAEQAKREDRLRMYLQRRADGSYALTVSAVVGEEPQQPT